MSALGDDVLYRPVTELAFQVRGRKISSVDLTLAYLQRMKWFDSRLNAVVTATSDLALRQARTADAEVRRGRYRGLLHGIPYGAKDLFATAGIPTTWGAVPCRNQVFNYDATVVRKLRDAGAVLTGKLAMVELAGGLGYRSAGASLTGACRNPWNPARWAGGSSSGSGAAVAAGLVGFALGTETWGSILCPAAFCGVTGLRPTYGRVSRAGVMPCADTFDKVGPLARSAADCRIVLEAIAGDDDDDHTAASEPVQLARGSGNRASRLRAALVADDFTVKGAEPEVKEAFGRAVGVLRSAGMRIEAVKLPELPASEVAGTLIALEAITNFEPFFRDGRVRQLKDPYAPYQPEINAEVSGADLVKAQRMRRTLQERMRDFFATYDVIVAPNFLSVAPTIDSDLYRALPYADPLGAIGNACGLPAIALPCGFGRDHMPAGLQIVGPPWSEGLLLDLGELFQQRTEFHQQRPPLRSTAR